MDAISLLKKDHAALRRLVTELAQAPSRAGRAGGELVQLLGRLMGLSAERREDGESLALAGGWTMAGRTPLSAMAPADLRAHMAELKRELLAVAAGAEPTLERRPAPPFPRQPLAPPGIEADMDPRPQYEARAYRGADKLKGDVALITGGDSGIGRSVAVLFAREGADVALVYLPEEQEDAEETARAVQAESRRALLLPGDVSDPEFCASAVEACVKEYGKLTVLVNNAAEQKHRNSIDELSIEDWRHIFDTNIHGYFYMVKAARPYLGRGARIIQTGSVTGLEGSGQLLDYAATKGAIHAFTKSLAKSLVEEGIRVNCVAPGPVWTPLNPAERSHEETAEFGSETAYGRPAQPEEIAPAFVFFASNADSSYATGEILALLGGEARAG
jgi:NAD(P)-dependent dehydrogenase (short-subunit alcohol dehydrogenase family)